MAVADKFVDGCEFLTFKNRTAFLIVFSLITLFLGYKATQIQLDASFNKNIPLNHEYMQTYLKHQKDFGGANGILVAVCDTSGNIFNPHFFESLRGVHDQLFYIPGVNRALVKSLFSPGTRFTEVVEDGFSGGPVIPADFAPNKAGLNIVKGNIEKAGIVGRMVSNDYSCSMVTAQLLDFDPQTGEKLDTLAVADQLEKDLRGKFESDKITVHIIGFAKVAGDVANGARGVLLFFLIAIAITAVMVYLFAKSKMLTFLPLMCSLIAVIWQMGLLSVIGFGIDPMSILVPFLVFAIGVSHGVQMINSMGSEVKKGVSCYVAAENSFKRLLIPGGVALLSDTVGFITLLAIDIGIIRELAITASLGVAVIIVTNLFLLPLLLCKVNMSQKYLNKVHSGEVVDDGIWGKMAAVTKPKVASVILILTAILFAFGWQQSKQMKIGDLHEGTPSLHEYSRYNQDTFLITDRFSISVDYISIMAEGVKQEDGDYTCTIFEAMDAIDQFQWRMADVAGVQSVLSLATVGKKINEAYNEGNPKWRVLSRNKKTLSQSVAGVNTSTGLVNNDCSVMPVLLFLEDHKAETIERVVAAAKENAALLSNDKVNFALATGPVGVMAATNEAVDAAQTPMMIYVYGAVIVLCLLSFRSARATISVVLPLFVVSTLAQALMTYLEIGLTVSTLPVIALGVGIGVDYGIYIVSTMSEKLKEGMPVTEAYIAALKERGNAVLFTGITLAVGVSTWVFSALKFQMDMGILLTFMFVVNMLAAVIVLPALAAFLWPNKKLATN